MHGHPELCQCQVCTHDQPIESSIECSSQDAKTEERDQAELRCDPELGVVTYNKMRREFAQQAAAAAAAQQLLLKEEQL